jgi:hypothetical protein
LILKFKARVNGGDAKREILIGDEAETRRPDHGGKGLLLRELPAYMRLV